MKLTWKPVSGYEEKQVHFAYDETGKQVASAYGNELYGVGSGKETYDTHENAMSAAEIRLSAIEEQRKQPKQYPCDEIPRSRNVISELSTDLKAFIREHRNTFFWIATAFLADHFFFNGAFRARLNVLVEKMIGKIEKRVEGITSA